MKKRAGVRADGLDEPGPGSPKADYIGEMAIQLAELAHADGFELLAHLLEMATLEAHGGSNLAASDAPITIRNGHA